ncbi:MAG: DNA alkylation repair protein [Propylenella sp.]
MTERQHGPARSGGRAVRAARAPTTASDAVRAEKTAAAVLAELRALGSETNRAGQARFGINTARAFGVSMAALRPLARRLKRDHALAAALWKSGIHEARILAALIDEPVKVTPAQMDRWVAAFDSWDLCDQTCTKLFVRTPFVEEKIAVWSADEREFVRRAGFALLAVHAVHSKKLPDKEFLKFLPLIERHATDPRNFVRKAVNWALRQIGKHSLALHGPALALAEKLAVSSDKTARWIGKDAAKELTDPVQIARIKARPKD